MTNKELLELCRSDPVTCRKEARAQAIVSVLALEMLGRQIGRCVVAFPENLSAEFLVETLTNLGLHYIKYTAEPGDDVGTPFSRAFMERYPRQD